MRNAWLELKLRLRRWRVGVRTSVALAALAVSHEIGATEVACLIGLVLVWLGLAQVSRAAADVVVGAVILWMAVPPRPPLIHRSPDPGGTKRV